MEAKYFKGRMYRDGRMCRFIIWDGEKNYRSVPPGEAIMAREFKGCFPGTLLIAHARQPWGNKDLGMLFGGDITCVIVWTRNHKVYQATVDKLMQESDARLQ